MTRGEEHGSRLAAIAAPGILAGCFLAFLGYAIAVQRGLFEDGAIYLMAMAERRAIVAPEISRWAASALVEWPALAALWAGVDSLPLLASIYTAGMLYLAPLTLGLCWLLLPAGRRDLFVFPLLSLLLGWMAACFLALSQSHVLELWFWPTLFAVMFLPLEGARARLALLALAAPTLVMYEGMSLLGPLLAFCAVRRLRAEPTRSGRIVLGLLAAWFAAGALVGIWFTLHPASRVNREYFLLGIVRLWFLRLDGWRINWPVATALVGAVLLGFAWHRPASMARRWALWAPPAALLLALAAAAPILLAGRFAPVMQTHARSWAVLMPFPLACLMLARELGWLPRLDPASPLSRRIIAGIALAQIAWQIAATAQWEGYVEALRQELAGPPGLHRHEDSALSVPTIGRQALAALGSGWTNSSMSIILAPRGRVSAILAAPEGTPWQPFDPAKPQQLPRIEGVDYGAYLAALP